MKKVLFSILLSLPVIIASAQSGGRTFGLGVNAGLSLFNLSNFEGSSKAGFTGGISATFPVSSNFYIQPEVNYQQQGSKSKENFSSEEYTSNDKEKLTLGYINVPVLAKYKFPTTRLSVYVGPQAGFLVSAKDHLESVSVDVKDYFKKFDFSGVYGLEYYFPLNTSSSITVNARYQTGFTNVVKESEDVSVKNHGFTFTVGYRF